MLPFLKVLPVKMSVFRSVTVFTVRGRRLVTQSCSLLSVAHTLTRQGWNICHDQHAASGSQNKLLTAVSLCWLRSYNHSEPEWAEAECHPKSHSVLGNLNHRDAHVRNSTRSLHEEKPNFGASISGAKQGHEPFPPGCARDEQGSLFSSNFSAAFSGHLKTSFVNQYFYNIVMTFKTLLCTGFLEC